MAFWQRLRRVSLVAFVAIVVLVLLRAAGDGPNTVTPQRTDNSFNF